jgi:hypothetical protein
MLGDIGRNCGLSRVRRFLAVSRQLIIAASGPQCERSGASSNCLAVRAAFPIASWAAPAPVVEGQLYHYQSAQFFQAAEHAETLKPRWRSRMDSNQRYRPLDAS